MTDTYQPRHGHGITVADAIASDTYRPKHAAHLCYRCGDEPISTRSDDYGDNCLDEISERMANAQLAEVVWLGNGGDDDGRWV